MPRRNGMKRSSSRSQVALGNALVRAVSLPPPLFPSVLLALVVLTLFPTTSPAQETDVPVAQPASTPSTPPVAQPVNEPPVAQPVAPATPPVAQPVAQPVAAPVAAPATATAPAPAAGGIVVTTPAAARFDTAMAFYTAGQYADAVTALSSFVADFPQNNRREEALYRLAESYKSLGRTEDALAAYTYQVQTYPDGQLFINGQLRRGAILFDQGKFTDAIAPLQLVSSKGDGELQQAANDLLGRCYLATQKEPEGRALLQALVDQQPPGKFSADAAEALAELDDTQSKWPEALALWQKALALATDPTAKAFAAARGGWSALQAKQTDVAEKLFQTARKFNVAGDARKVVNTGLLRILFEHKRYSDWLKLYLEEKDNVLTSAHEEILYDLGQAQFNLKHWAEAVTAFDQYLAEFSSQEAAMTVAYQRFLAAAQLDHTKTLAEGEAFLKAWPQSPYRARVQLLEAQELSAQKKYTDALPLWETLAAEPAKSGWPHQDILLQLARTYDILENFPKAASAYQAFLDDVHSHQGESAGARTVLNAQARLAVCLQKSNQLMAATDAWKGVQSLAPDGSKEQQMALESLGLIYSRGGPSQNKAEVATFRTLLDKFPQTSLAPMAAFSVGDALFKDRDYAGAEPYLLKARTVDAKTWMQPATQRLVLGAYGMKNYDKTVAYLKEYEALPVPTDAQGKLAARLPAALFYWLAETARKDGKWNEAKNFYGRVTTHPDPGDLLAGAWLQLGEVQSHLKDWPAAVTSYETYRKMKPDSKDATVILLALGKAQLGAGNFDAAKSLGEQALSQEPEGPNSASARMLLGETALAAKDYTQAARMFGTLALLFDDPKIGAQATARTAESYEKAGDAKSAAQWKQKLKDKYPDFQPSPYL